MNSDEVRYSSDSNIYSVTSVPQKDSFNSLWTVFPANNEPERNYDDFLKCDDLIKLQHAATKKVFVADPKKPMLSSYKTAGCVDAHEAKEADGWRLICVNQDPGSVIQG